MRPTPRHSYLRFLFLDPRGIAQGNRKPTFEISTFVPLEEWMLGSPFYDNTFTERAQYLIGTRPMEHTAEGRAALEREYRIAYDRVSLYYCVTCGNRLRTNGCQHCGVAYPQHSISLLCANPELPEPVAQYVVTVIGHQFAT